MAVHPAGDVIVADLLEQLLPARSSLIQRAIPGDGECQFRSITCQVPSYGYEGARRLRADVVSHVQARFQEYINFFHETSEQDPYELFQNWLQGMRRKKWGDNVSLRAAANLIHRPIVVWRKNSDQAPTIILNMDYDVNNPAPPVYTELDERRRGCEHFSALLLGSNGNALGRNLSASGRSEISGSASSKANAKPSDLYQSPSKSRDVDGDGNLSPFQTPRQKRQRLKNKYGDQNLQENLENVSKSPFANRKVISPSQRRMSVLQKQNACAKRSVKPVPNKCVTSPSKRKLALLQQSPLGAKKRKVVSDKRSIVDISALNPKSKNTLRRRLKRQTNEECRRREKEKRKSNLADSKKTIPSSHKKKHKNKQYNPEKQKKKAEIKKKDLQKKKKSDAWKLRKTRKKNMQRAKVAEIKKKDLQKRKKSDAWKLRKTRKKNMKRAKVASKKKKTMAWKLRNSLRKSLRKKNLQSKKQTHMSLLKRIHEESGFLVSKNSQRLHMYTDAPSNVPESLFADVERDIQYYGEVTSDDKRAMVKAYSEAVDIDAVLAACASCGRRDPANPAEREFNICNLPEEHWLRMSTEEVEAMESMPTVALVNEDGETRNIMTKHLCSYYVSTNEEYFHLHTELIARKNHADASFFVCQTCANAMKKPNGKAPSQSLAAGRDYGLFSRVDIEEPNALEEMLLAEVRTYSVVAKVHVPNVKRTAATRHVLKGHMIGFFHDGPKEIMKHFSEARINKFLDDVQVVFVGSEGKLSPLEMRALRKHPALQLRPHVLYNHLIVRKAISGNEDIDVPTIQDIVELLQDLQTRLIERAREVADDAIEKRAQPSDVANVRDVAMDSEHYHQIEQEVREAAQELDSEEILPGIQFDAVGVFMHSTSTVAGSMIEGLSSYLQSHELENPEDADRHESKQKSDEGEEEKEEKDNDEVKDNESSKAIKSMKIRRAAQPINEFAHNDDLLYGGFWFLFPLQKGLPTTGSLNAPDSRHLITQFHNLYAQNSNFLFLLANQTQRHAATRGVSLRVKSDNLSFKTFARVLANKEEYCSKIEAAKQDPTSKEARLLLKEVSRFAASAGKFVPWSGEERSHEITKLYAMSRRFGSFSSFLTCAPDDVHQARGIRLSYRAGSPDVFPCAPDKLSAALQRRMPEDEIEIFFKRHFATTRGDDEYTFPFSELFLQRLATMNPVATTLVYEEIADAIFTHLVGVLPSNKRKTMRDEKQKNHHKGLLGLGRAWHYVTETNGRKSFHFHAAVVGGLSPTLLADVAGYKRLEEAVFRALDSVYKAYVPPEVHVLDIMRKFFRSPVPRQTYFRPAMLDNEEGIREFETNAAITAISLNNHAHAATCHKGKSGKLGCRMAKPSGRPVEKTRVLAVELKKTCVSNENQDGSEEERHNSNDEGDNEDDVVEWKCSLCTRQDTRNRLHARIANTTDSTKTDTLLSYELCRPHITPEQATTATLKQVLALKNESDLDLFLEQTTAVTVVGQIAVDIDYLLQKPAIDPELRENVRNISEEDAVSLLKNFQKQIRCRNADLVEYCPSLSGTVHCNTAPLMLGAGDTAKAAAMYMCKYMVKDAFELAACLSVLADARRNMNKYPSTADDSGSAERNVRHFLQKVLNAGNIELSPTQAAAIVLGIPSSKHSHNFQNAYVWDAVTLRSVLQRGGRFLRQASEQDDDGESEENADEEVVPNNGTENVPESVSEEDLDDDFLDKGKKGISSVFRIPGRDPIAISQAEHYAYRAKTLMDLNFDEFVMSMQLSKISEADDEEEKKHASGRPMNEKHPFLPLHPLHGLYELQEKAKFDIPILVGAPPPSKPPPIQKGIRNKGNTTARKKRFLEYAKYYSALFIPWHASEGKAINYSPNFWIRWHEKLKRRANSASKDPKNMEEAFVAQGRLFRIAQVENVLKTKTAKANILNEWRCRNRKLWNDDDDIGHDGILQDMDPNKAAKADKEIRNLREEAQTKGDPRVIKRKANQEAWADENFKILSTLTEDYESLVPFWLEAGPDKEGAPIREAPGDLESFLDELKKPRLRASSPNESNISAVQNGEGAASESMPEALLEISEKDYDEEVLAWKRAKDNMMEGEEEPQPPLNVDQRAFGRELLRAQRILARAWQAGETRSEAVRRVSEGNLRQIQLLQGAGGVGKSVLLKAMKRIMLEEGLGEMVVTGWTGVAAAPFGTPTLCTLLKINFTQMKEPPKMDRDKISALIAEFRAAACDPELLLLFVIDEISFIVPEALEMVNIEMQHLTGVYDVPFGGVLLLLAGDFTQKPPPNALSLAETLISSDVTKTTKESRAVDPVSNRAKGIAHFRQARRTVLERLMRADDVKFQEEQKQVRDTRSSNPVPESLLKDLREISKTDLQKDASWAFATICVLSNFERHHLNRLQAHNFAKIHDLPLVMWKRKIGNAWAAKCEKAELEELYENEPGAWEYFVKGAPAVLTENIQPTKFLTNGATGFFHSLTLKTSQTHLEETICQSGFQVIELEEPPRIVNFQVTLPKEDTGENIGTLVEGVIVIPVLESRNKLEYDTSSLFSCLKGAPKTLRCSTFPIDIAFAVTDYKLQGKTKEKLVMSLAPRPFPPHHDLKGFYVAISRVRKRNQLRVLHKPTARRGGLDHIRNLQHSLELKIWYESYTGDGDYSRELALLAHEKLKDAPSNQRKKQYKATD